MSGPTFTRAGFFTALAGAALTVAGPAFAARNQDAEQVVQTNAANALATLSNRSVTPAVRRQTFNQLMNGFADFPRIATFVLGAQGRQLRSNAALRTEWNRVFADYALAVYEDQLDRYRGNTISVTGSVERTAGTDVIVQSTMQARAGARALPVQWRMLRGANGWRVVDVSLIMEGNEIWLAQQQQRDFLAILDRNNGDMRALITDVEAMTNRMRQRTLARG